MPPPMEDPTYPEVPPPEPDPEDPIPDPELPVCDKGEGGRTWSHHFEDPNLLEGDPCGFTADTAISSEITYGSGVTLTNEIQTDGSKSLKYTAPWGVASAVMSPAIVSWGSGRIEFDWRPIDSAEVTLARVRVDSNNLIRVMMAGTANVPRIYYTQNGTTVLRQAAEALGATQRWYRVRFGWDVYATSKNLWIETARIDPTTGELTNVALDEFTVALNIITGSPLDLVIGNLSNGAATGYIDNFHIYNNTPVLPVPEPEPEDPEEPLVGYFIDGSTGDDSNAGTEASPWKTIGKANATLVPGNTVYIRGGTYSERINPVNNGSANGRITYKAYPGETVTINYWSTGLAQANLESKSYITIDGIKFVNAGWMWINTQYGVANWLLNCEFNTANNFHGIRLWDSSYCIVRGCTFRSGPGVIGTTEDPYGTPADHFTMYRANYTLIENNQFYDATHYNAAASGNSTGTRGIHNVFRNNYCENRWHAALGLTTYAQYNLIEGNIFAFTGEDCLDNPDLGESCVSGSRFDRATAGASLQLLGASHNIVRRNICYHGGIINVAASYNSTTLVKQPCEYNKLVHNTIYKSQKGFYYVGSSKHGPWKNLVFKNNVIAEAIDRIFYMNPYDRNDSVNTWRNNHFHNPGKTAFYKGTSAGDTLSAIIGAWPGEFSGNQSGDPKFTNKDTFNFTPAADSPLRNSGDWLTTITSPTGSGTSFTVADPGYFMDGWGIIEGDLIQLQGYATPVRITSVNYSTKVITVNQSVSWTQGLGVAYQYNESAPDIGAIERPS